jgi:small subunit ribosomal protein S10
MLHFHSYGPDVPNLDFFVDFSRRVAASLDIPCSGPTFLPTRTRLVTVPRSPFAHKRSQQNFWRKTHGRSLTLWDAHDDAVDVLVAYLNENAMPNIKMQTRRTRYRPVDWGKDLASTADLRQSVIESSAQELMAELEAKADAADKVAAEGGVDAKAAPGPLEVVEEKVEEVVKEKKEEVKKE